MEVTQTRFDLRYILSAVLCHHPLCVTLHRSRGVRVHYPADPWGPVMINWM